MGADRAFVMPGEAIVVWIEGSRRRDGARLPLVTSEAWVMSLGGATPGRLFPVTFHDDGLDGDQAAGDRRYSARFVPAERKELDAAKQVMVQALVELDGVTTQVSRDFTYAPRPVLEVLAMRDVIEDGNLVVTLDVDVKEGGVHSFAANVMSGDGLQAIAYVDISYTLAAGRHAVKLPFFGRAFVDKRVPGPYLVKDVRGMLRSFGTEANIPWSDPRTLTTRPYAIRDLSPSEWQGDERRATLEAMQRLEEQTATGELVGQPSGHIHIDEQGAAHVVR